MKAKRLFLGLLTATVLFTPLAALKPASARSITVANPKANLIAQGGVQVAPEITIDPVAIGEAINNAVGTAKNRGGFIKSVMEQSVIEAKKGNFNVMVFNLNQDYETDIRNSAVFFKKVEYDGTPYGVWIFKEGEFVNKGDGGWINWAFYGNFTRNGKNLSFR